MAEEDTPVGGLEVLVVLEPFGGCGPPRVDAQDLVGDPARVEAVGDRVGADRREDQPGGRDLLVADEGDDAPGDGATRATAVQMAMVRARDFVLTTSPPYGAPSVG